jgi:hypothetical protein
MAKDTDIAAKGDHLKYYCVVFGILVAVIAVVAIQQKGKLDDFRAANAHAERLLTGKGMPATTRDGRPNSLPDLAVDIQKLVQGFKKSMGDEGVASTEGISQKRMKAAAFAVNMTQTYAGPEQDDPNRGKRWRTLSREFTYGPATLEQLTKLIWNIESWGRYRVFELRWKLAPEKENPYPPGHRVSKPVIKVGYREHLVDTGRR